jgi:hypothetical protein
LEAEVEHGAFVGLLPPNARADGTMTNLMNELVFWFCGWGFVSHNGFVWVKEGKC